MKKYYIFINEQQLGPFDIEELRLKNITRQTKVWFEGLQDWKNVEDIEELKDFINTLPPTIQSFSSPTPPKFKNSDFEFEHDEYPKILGLKRNIFIFITVTILILGLTWFVTSERTRNHEQINSNIESANTLQVQEQQQAIEEQNARLAEQEKIEAQRAEKERKEKIEKQIIIIGDDLDYNYQKLSAAQNNLADVSSFKLLRSSSDKYAQITAAQIEVDLIKQEIAKLQIEYDKLQSEKSK